MYFFNCETRHSHQNQTPIGINTQLISQETLETKNTQTTLQSIILLTRAVVLLPFAFTTRISETQEDPGCEFFKFNGDIV